MSERPRALLAVWFEVQADLDEEFNEWYDREHLPERELVPGFLSARRFAAAGQTGVYLALYDLEHVGVLRSPEYLRISGENESPWTRRMRRKATRLVRAVYEQTLPAPGAGVWVLGPHAPLGDPTGAALLSEELYVTDGIREQVNEWCARGDVPAELSKPGYRAVRRFRALEGTPDVLTLYELASLDVLPGGGREIEGSSQGNTIGVMAASGPLAPQRTLYRQIYP